MSGFLKNPTLSPPFMDEDGMPPNVAMTPVPSTGRKSPN